MQRFMVQTIASSLVGAPDIFSSSLPIMTRVYPSANLNEAYFTNRQDRYLHFKQHTSLANYCFDFLQAASSVSYRLLPADSPDTMSVPRSSHSYTRENYALVWSDQDTHPHHFNDKFRQALSDLQAKAKTLHTQGAVDQNPHNAILLPVIQGGQFNIREEQEMFELLFKYLKQNASRSEKGSRPLMDLTSGYFGLSEKYQDLVLGCPDVDVRIVAASPKVCFTRKNSQSAKMNISVRRPTVSLAQKASLVVYQKAIPTWNSVL